MVIIRLNPANMCAGCKYLSPNGKFCLSDMWIPERRGICKSYERKEQDGQEDLNSVLE
ncbi:MAG: hypothetical protein HY776_04470 [Actinobacteria bacterium]|nr:hypothetical protein [Actinomycetota bacterium]